MYEMLFAGMLLAGQGSKHLDVEHIDPQPKEGVKEHENPRQGKRIVAGTIQLQAHDAGTEVEFRNIRVAEWK